MVTQPASLADILQAIIDKAPGLRAAGVTSVGGEVPFTLAPAVPREDKVVRTDADIGDVRDFIGEHARHGREDAS
jgi:hypothetical protein